MEDKKTDKVQKGLDLISMLKWAKGNPWLITVVAIAGGTGGQEAMAQLGQTVAWWHIALAVAGFALFDVGTRMLSRMESIEKQIERMNARLAEGAEVMQAHGKEIELLKDWKAKVKSNGKLRPSGRD